MQISQSMGRIAAGIGLGYLAGSLPSADLATHLATTDDLVIDLRDHGSTNPGAVNAGATLGKKWGAVVMAVDVLKGTAAAMIGRSLAGPIGANLAASAAVAGHCYPLGSRSGGKGVSTSIGQVIGTFPLYLPLDIAVAVGTATLPRWTQRTWAATATASTVWVASSTVAYRRRWPTGVDAVAPFSLPIAAAISSAIIAKRFADTPLVDGKPIDDSGVPDVPVNEGTARTS